MRDLGPILRVVVVAVLSTTCLALGFASIGGAAPVAHSPVPGYWLIGADGGVFSFNAPFFGSTATECAASQFPAQLCASAIASTPDGGGYTIVSPFDIPFPLAQSQPAVATQFGDATGNGDCSVHFNAAGGPGSLPLGEEFPWEGIASTASGDGFWLLSAGGTVATCGDAAFFGQPGLATGPFADEFFPNSVGIAATPDGKGYWVVANDGGVFAYGDAGFYGSMGGKPLNAPVVGIAATPDGKGYWLVASDGGIFAFGDAGYLGSMGGQNLNAPMVGIAANPYGAGYWMVALDGGVFSFGDAPFEGSMGGQSLNGPIFGIASRAG